tara:strand:- start:3313 stop:4494 length:1182 start_codon:yes stop_codon:yes gene_type:complete
MKKKITNIARSAKYGIHIDYEKSTGSYLYDKTTQRPYLDFFGMYASLPLGFNHPIFQSPEFIEEYIRCSSFKVNNCEFVSDETLEFDSLFVEYAGQNFRHFHYTCTGALAVEAAIKTSIEYKKCHSPTILSFHNSFHGINSYGGFVTSRFPGADRRLNGFPEAFSVKVDCSLEQVKDAIKEHDLTCILVEPIQCSVGDVHHDRTFFQGLRNLCTEHDIPLIFDEIQVGFGGSGKLWYHEVVEVLPDIVIFGKKTQLSGIMVAEGFGDIFNPGRNVRLEVTWDGDVADMIRCKYIIKAYQKYGILENVKRQSTLIREALSTSPTVLNFRNCGLIIGFDLNSSNMRDRMVEKLYSRGFLCNSTGIKSIRLRPNLNLSDADTQKAIDLIVQCGEEL